MVKTAFSRQANLSSIAFRNSMFIRPEELLKGATTAFIGFSNRLVGLFAGMAIKRNAFQP